DALVDVGVPAVKGERADPRTLRLREEFGRSAGRVGKVGANLGDAAALDHWALVTRLAVHVPNLRDRREPDALLEQARKRWIGMAVEVEETHRRVVADRRQPRRNPGEDRRRP